MKKLIILFAVVLLVLSSCSVSQSGLGEGDNAPNFTLKSIDGTSTSLSDYKGRIVVLNFFGVWCPWCVKEMPGFVKLYDEYKDKGVQLVVVDVGDSSPQVSNYLKSNGFTIMPLMDESNEVSGRYQISGYPTTYIIDKDGVTRKINRGYMDENTLKSLLDSMIAGR